MDHTEFEHAMNNYGVVALRKAQEHVRHARSERERMERDRSHGKGKSGTPRATSDAHREREVDGLDGQALLWARRAHAASQGHLLHGRDERNDALYVREHQKLISAAVRHNRLIHEPMEPDPDWDEDFAGEDDCSCEE